MEYKDVEGRSRPGYFCHTCGKGCNMYSTGHGTGKCESNPELVKQLIEANKR